MGSISSIFWELFPPRIGTGGARAETMASFIDPFCGKGESGGGVGGREDVRGV
jgi:hypothetical protein